MYTKSISGHKENILFIKLCALLNMLGLIYILSNNYLVHYQLLLVKTNALRSTEHHYFLLQCPH
jgi:hypothetical protein